MYVQFAWKHRRMRVKRVREVGICPGRSVNITTTCVNAAFCLTCGEFCKHAIPPYGGMVIYIYDTLEEKARNNI